MVRRNARRVVLALVAGALIGLVITLCLPSGAQTDGTGWQDKTFALAQHPATGVGPPGVFGGGWLPFDFSHGKSSNLMIWDGGSSGRRALVSVWCQSGHIDVTWDETTIHLYEYGGGSGNTITVYATQVKVTEYHDLQASAVATGEYMVTVDIAE